jgi:hypothetical protein
LFLSNGPSGNNFRVVPHLPTALGVGINRFGQGGAFVKGKVQDVRVCRKNVWNEWHKSFLRSPKKSVRHASRELENSTMIVWRVLPKQTGNEALSSSLVAVSSIILIHGV